jgi:hypothetical protein
VGGDEVFFGLPVLVLAELASGYLFTEVQCENRRYETWKAQIQSWWSQAGWECHFMVSDRAKALIKLATETQWLSHPTPSFGAGIFSTDLEGSHHYSQFSSPTSRSRSVPEA